MKKNNMACKFCMLILYSIIFVLISSVVYSAIGATHPSDLELRPGQSDRFKFEIQAVSHDYDVECSYILDKKEDFNVVFDQESPVSIDAGGVFLVTGTVTVNETKEPGTYTRNMEVSCRDIIDQIGGGGSAAIGVYNIFLNVNVVGERTRENIYVSPPPSKKPFISASVAATLIALVIIIIALFLLIRRRRKSMLEK